MKPQDVVVLLKIMHTSSIKWTVRELSSSLFISLAETHASIKRCEKSGLIDILTKNVRLSAFEEFLIYGFQYVFPVQPGAQVRGVPTAHSAFPLSEIITSASDDVYVWPYEYGKVRGFSIKPLYKSVPKIAENDKNMYECLSLLDGLRIGRVREKKIAADELHKRIEGLN